MNTGDLLADLLVEHGVEYVFGIPGGQSLPLYDAIARRQEEINHILIRDERSGPYAADAYARVKGKLAACDAVPGPGVVKLPSGLYEAQATSVPLIAIAADLPSEYRPWKRYASAAQGLDQVSLLTGVCKSIISVESQAELPAIVRQAFREATTGRPGPVVLNIPADVFHQEWNPETLPATVDERYSVFPAMRTRPLTEAIRDAASLLLEAQRPVMVVGGGGLLSRAWDEILELAEAQAVPVATTVTGKGAIAEDHPLGVGVLGGQYAEESANAVVREADVVFLAGFKSAQQSTFAWTLPRSDQQVIHLDIDPYEIGKVFQTRVGLVGDVRASLRDLLTYLAESESQAPGRNEWLDRVSTAKSEWQAEIEPEAIGHSPIRPQQVMNELERQLDPSAIVVSDASFSVGWVGSFYDIRRPGRRCLFPRGSATLGASLSMAIGASLAEPDHQVVCVVGDGGVTYSISELATCRKYDLNIILIVLNNSCLGYSKWEESLREQNYENTDFPLTDFAQIAEGFGCTGLRVEAPGEVEEAVLQALRTEGPVVVDIAVDEWATPELNHRKVLAQGEA